MATKTSPGAARETFILILERTCALGLAGKVTISHALAVAEVPEARLDRLVEGLAAQRVSLTTVASGNRLPLPPGQAARCQGDGRPWL
jgi:cytosine deaminase